MPEGSRFRPWQRLSTRAEFDRVFRTGWRLDGRLFVLLAAPNGRTLARLGLTVGRRLGGATDRNRARRLLRESFRRQPPDAARGLDLVLLAKADIVGRSQAEVDREYRDRIRRLPPAGGRSGAGPSTSR
jgi:ribonuclease P protein component